MKRSRAVVATFLAALVVYLPSLIGPFQFDDYGVIVEESAVHSWGAWWSVGAHGLRPLLKASYVLNWVLGSGALGFHVFNLAVHLVNVALVGLFCRAALRSTAGAIFAMALFALHPIQTEAVTYISGRSASFMATAYLGALLAYVYGTRDRRPVLSLFVSPLLFIVAVLIKEVALTLPLALILWERCIERSSVRVIAGRVWLHAAMFVALVVVAIVHPSYYSLLYDITGARPLAEAVLYQIDGIGYLLSRFVAMHRLSILPGLGATPPSVVRVVVVVTLSVALLWWTRRRPWALFGMLWFFLHTFIPYVFLPRVDVLNEHHMYLANVGLFLALGGALSSLCDKARKPTLILNALGLALLAAFTVTRNLDYRSELALWENTVEHSPPNPHAFNNLGVAYRYANRYDEARAAFNRALELAPQFEAPAKNLSKLPPASARP